MDWRRNGPKPRPVADRFWEKVDQSGECWIWMGARTSRGYGVLQVAKHPVYVHRLALELDGRPLKEGQMACHTCDNPPCVRASHLFVGDAVINAADMAAKGRAYRGPKPQEQIAKMIEGRKRWEAEHPYDEASYTHCVHGHEYTPDNTYRNKDGSRHCRTCVIAQQRAYRQRVKRAA